VAELECGHTQHLRHTPPWQVRPWVLTSEGRASRIGTRLPCRKCGDARAGVAESMGTPERVRSALGRSRWLPTRTLLYEDSAARVPGRRR
jgi:hypothetical protein